MIDLRSVIYSFGSPLVIIRQSPGTWTDGIYTPGVETTVNAIASVQPVGADARLLPEGVRVEDSKAVWANVLLGTAEDPESYGADRFRYRGWLYEVVRVDDWQSGNHGLYSKAIAVRIKDPNESR